MLHEGKVSFVSTQVEQTAQKNNKNLHNEFSVENCIKSMVHNKLIFLKNSAVSGFQLYMNRLNYVDIT